MSDVSIWTLFAYMTGDEEGTLDERRRPTEWQLQDVLRWCVERGYDNIYFRRDPVQKTRFRRDAAAPVRHHMHVVEGVGEGEPGDDAA